MCPYTRYQCNLCESKQQVEHISGEQLNPLFGSELQEGFSGFHRPSCSEFNDESVLTYDDVDSLFGENVTESLAFLRIVFDGITFSKTMLAIPDDAEFEYRLKYS